MRFFVVICLYLFSTAAFAKRLAVLDFTSTKAEADVLSVMAEMVRNTAANQLAPSGVKVMDKANMLSLLQDQGKDASCISGQCEIDLGRNIGADYVVMGQLTVLDGDWILNLSLYDTASGSKLKGQTIEKPSSKALRRALNDETRLLLSALKKRSFQTDSIQEGFGTQDDEDDWNPGGETLASVRFESQPPGAAVLLKGDVLCTTPCSKDLTVGRHQVRFSKERYVSKSRVFMAKNGISLTVRLEPKFGWLTVKSNPAGVDLFLDGKPIGKTPIIKREIDPGEHIFKVNSPCYKPLEYRFQSKVGEHKTDIPNLPLKARQSAIQVSANKGENSVVGDVYVDGKILGQTGQVIKVPLCSKTVEVRTTNGWLWSGQLSLKEKQVTKIRAQLSSDRRDYGQLKIVTEPENLVVYVNGQRIGNSPIVQLYPSGRYDVFTIDNCGRKDEESIRLNPSQNVTLRLDPGASTKTENSGLKIWALNEVGLSIPAEVRIDGKLVGKTPFFSEVDQCPKDLEVKDKKGNKSTVSLKGKLKPSEWLEYRMSFGKQNKPHVANAEFWFSPSVRGPALWDERHPSMYILRWWTLDIMSDEPTLFQIGPNLSLFPLIFHPTPSYWEDFSLGLLEIGISVGTRPLRGTSIVASSNVMLGISPCNDSAVFDDGVEYWTDIDNPVLCEQFIARALDDSLTYFFWSNRFVFQIPLQKRRKNLLGVGVELNYVNSGFEKRISSGVTDLSKVYLDPYWSLGSYLEFKFGSFMVDKWETKAEIAKKRAEAANQDR